MVEIPSVVPDVLFRPTSRDREITGHVLSSCANADYQADLMQFIANGPDIPNALLQAHEEGRAVFFCGAGISYSAGLPDFQGLVDGIYQRLGTTRTDIEEDAYRRSQFDTALDLLERRIPGQRIAVRRALADVLQPNLRLRGATQTHAALLQLARSREGTLRLVTTNFDRVFEHAARRTKQSYQAYAAPTLPVPKTNRWNGLVHLHGLLPAKLDETELHRLVVTSGDFGLAYLTERWAARFVGELFRNYVVCFVGYSINDPVLRYMMDALAADRMLGEDTPQAYALGGCEPGKETASSNEWNSKGVLPILYEVRPGKYPHSALQETLKTWADTHRDGIFGRERIVVELALTRPSTSTRQDDFVGRMIWALSDKSGLPAKRFAEINPAPPLEWLTAFSEMRFQCGDLSRFGISSQPSADDDLRFSLINRPASYKQTSWMTLCGGGHDTTWDDVMSYIARWMIRHLNDPLLIHWVLENGSNLNVEFADLIKFELDHQDSLLRDENTGELDRIRANSPNAIPNKWMRTLWRLFLGGCIKSYRIDHDPDLYRWVTHLKHDGLSTLLRMELRNFLTPLIDLRKPFRWPDEDEDEETEPSDHVRNIVGHEIVLTANRVRSAIGDRAAEHWQSALPDLLDDLQQLLRDALDLLQQLGEADDCRDGSFSDLPSIEPHWQNRGFRDWVLLIELLRDAWLMVWRRDPARAALIAERWFELPYPTFKRLALYAASKQDCISPAQWTDWLLSDESWWLWSVETKREVMRLLVLQGSNLSVSQGKLEAAILDGPPRHMYKENLETGYWEEIVDRDVWLCLAKLDKSGLGLGNDARNRFQTLSSAHPEWRLLPHEREEFSAWMSGTGDPDYQEYREFDSAPRKHRELIQWLKKPSRQELPFYRDNWPETCGTRFFHCLCALHDLAKDGNWPVARWKEALPVWSKENQIQRSWRYAAPLIRTIPDNILQEAAHSIAWWLNAASNSIERHENILLDLCQRILDLSPESESVMTQDGESIQRPFTESINHPVGLVAEALLFFGFRSEPNDGDRLPADIEPLLTKICDIQKTRLRHGRVILASRVISLFRIDPSWTSEHLLPHFSWTESPEEARLAWEGFLVSPRRHGPLLMAFREQFLETASHYSSLIEHGPQYAAILTYEALEYTEEDMLVEFQRAFNALPTEGLEEAARTFSQTLDSTGEQCEEYWANRIRPFWQNIWPKSRDYISGDIVESLALTSISAGDRFAEAVDLFHDWLQPIDHPSNVVHRLQSSGLCARFPMPALRLLGAVIQNPRWRPSELDQCLADISQANPELKNDDRYQRMLA